MNENKKVRSRWLIVKTGLLLCSFSISFLFSDFCPLTSMPSAYAVPDGDGADYLVIGNDDGSEDAGDDFIIETYDATRLVTVESDTGEVGIGTADPESALEIDTGTDTETTAILTLDNNDGDMQFFVSDGTPEAAITGNTGDLAIDVTGGSLYIKTDDGDNTNWETTGGGAFTADGQTQITPTTPILLDEATGDETALDLTFTANKATSGDVTGLYIEFIDTASPGSVDLLELANGGGTVFRINDDGTLHAGSGQMMDLENRYFGISSSQIDIFSGVFQYSNGGGDVFLDGGGQIYGSAQMSMFATTGSSGGEVTVTGTTASVISPDGTDQMQSADGTLTFQTASTTRMDITDSGVQLGGANARVTTILDEDNMASDSATALATQQSIKAYVDNETNTLDEAYDQGGAGVGRAITVDTGAVNLEGAENIELLNLEDTTNTDSMGFFVGSGTPESAVTAQLGSVYFDHAGGAAYIKDTGDATNTGWQLLASGADNFDEVYAQSITDGDLNMEVDNASGLTYELTSGNFIVNLSGTNDFVVQDNGTAMATFNDNSSINFTNSSSEFIDFLDGTYGLHVDADTAATGAYVESGSDSVEMLGGSFDFSVNSNNQETMNLIQNSANRLAVIENNSTGVTMDIDANSATTSNVIELSATALTTGDALNITATPSGTGSPINLTRSASGRWLEMNDGTDEFGIYNRAGTPEGNITANTGSLAIDTSSGDLYIKGDDGDNTTWSSVSDTIYTGDSTIAGARTVTLDAANNLTFSTNGGTGQFIVSDGTVNYLSIDPDNLSMTLGNADDPDLTFAGNGAVTFETAATFQIPADAAPTLTAEAQIALDNNVSAELNDLLMYQDDGSNDFYVIAVPTANLPGGASDDGKVLAYNDTNDNFEFVNGMTALSAITAATATNTIDSTNFAQTWNWSTASTQNPFAMSFNALTSGTGFGLSSTSTGLTGDLASISLTGNNAANTGNLLDLTTSGAASAAIPLSISNSGTGDSVAINHSANGIVFDIESSATTADVIDINASALTTGNLIQGTVANTVSTDTAMINIVGTALDAATEVRVNEISTTLGNDVDVAAVHIERGANDARIFYDEGEDEWQINQGDTTTTSTNAQLQGVYVQASQPGACSDAAVPDMTGRMWFDTDTGIMYVCDTSNGRDKWLSTTDVVMFGDESGSCSAGADPNSNANCNVDWGNGLGPDGSTQLGFYVPYASTVVGYGFSADNDACTSGSFDVEVWSTGSNSDDNNYTLEATVASALDNQAHNSNTSNVDLAGDQYILWGIDNNCGQNIDDFNIVLYLRWRSS